MTLNENRPVITRRAYNHQYEIYAGWDENERSREVNGRIYISSRPRRVYLCRRVNESGEVESESFDRRRDAVKWGDAWLDAAN